mmetsp:Transcript_40042/g.128453  ORF Transcript_40042/g.128453 Transcript_40042/m.128453 type:complete len:216 (+) Transcript_40042:1522-2169(+)
MASHARMCSSSEVTSRSCMDSCPWMAPAYRSRKSTALCCFSSSLRMASSRLLSAPFSLFSNSKMMRRASSPPALSPKPPALAGPFFAKHSARIARVRPATRWSQQTGFVSTLPKASRNSRSARLTEGCCCFRHSRTVAEILPPHSISRSSHVSAEPFTSPGCLGCHVCTKFRRWYTPRKVSKPSRSCTSPRSSAKQSIAGASTNSSRPKRPQPAK